MKSGWLSNLVVLISLFDFSIAARASTPLQNDQLPHINDISNELKIRALSEALIEVVRGEILTTPNFNVNKKYPGIEKDVEFTNQVLSEAADIFEKSGYRMGQLHSANKALEYRIGTCGMLTAVAELLLQITPVPGAENLVATSVSQEAGSAMRSDHLFMVLHQGKPKKAKKYNSALHEIFHSKDMAYKTDIWAVFSASIRKDNGYIRNFFSNYRRDCYIRALLDGDIEVRSSFSLSSGGINLKRLGFSSEVQKLLTAMSANLLETYKNKVNMLAGSGSYYGYYFKTFNSIYQTINTIQDRDRSYLKTLKKKPASQCFTFLDSNDDLNKAASAVSLIQPAIPAVPVSQLTPLEKIMTPVHLTMADQNKILANIEDNNNYNRQVLMNDLAKIIADNNDDNDIDLIEDLEEGFDVSETIAQLRDHASYDLSELSLKRIYANLCSFLDCSPDYSGLD